MYNHSTVDITKRPWMGLPKQRYHYRNQSVRTPVDIFANNIFSIKDASNVPNCHKGRMIDRPLTVGLGWVGPF